MQLCSSGLPQVALTLSEQQLNIPILKFGQHHSCWCCDCWCHQGIMTHNIDNVSIVRQGCSCLLLTYYGLVTPYIAPQNLVNIGLGNGLVPDGTKPLPEPLLTHQWGLVTVTVSQEGNLMISGNAKISTLDMSMQISNLTHWGQVTHTCCSINLAIIGSDNGLSPDRHQAIIWTNAGIFFIEPWGTNFNEISIKIQPFSQKKMALNMSSGKWRPFCLGLNVLRLHYRCIPQGPMAMSSSKVVHVVPIERYDII